MLLHTWLLKQVTLTLEMNGVESGLSFIYFL
jgi:hypothetical protein